MSKLSKTLERAHEKARKKMKADGTRRGKTKRTLLLRERKELRG